MVTHSRGLVAAPRKVDLFQKPADVAAALKHLPGLMFFDTSGNLPTRSRPPVSIIAARPVEVLKGHIENQSELAALQHAISGWQTKQPSIGFPTGGACGWIDYEGAFCFGMYPEMLIYQHQQKQWWQCGELIDAMQTQPDARDPVSMSEFEPLMTQYAFEDGVRKIHDYIAAGDIYQVNLAQKFIAEVSGGSLFPLYQDLRRSAPSPLAVWMNLGGREILSSSPETFLRISGRNIETRPIKGTRPRFTDPAADAASAKDLLESEKENAELIMITDLERNDLGRVCEFGTVKVTDMLALEKLEHVYHLVSTVTGTLREEIDHLSALVACFPGGSITGAPKKRAREIIRELEPVPRGLYTGTMGYMGFNGESQMNIPIRTLVREKNQLHYHVGAGIVADSDPIAEYEETLQKAKGIRLAIKNFRKIDETSPDEITT